uniref:LSM domain-containing protein n=1 Tax=Chara braunii TaxID=69332 RepID=A0A388K9E8_CHABU
MAGLRPPRSERTLVCVIQSLVGMEVVVELRNDLTIRGNLDECDDYMKLEEDIKEDEVEAAIADLPRLKAPGLDDMSMELYKDFRKFFVVLLTAAYNEALKCGSFLLGFADAYRKLPFLFVRGCMIRFIHIPDSVDVKKAVQQRRDKRNRAEIMYLGRGGPQSRMPKTDKVNEGMIKGELREVCSEEREEGEVVGMSQ